MARGRVFVDVVGKINDEEAMLLRNAKVGSVSGHFFSYGPGKKIAPAIKKPRQYCTAMEVEMKLAAWIVTILLIGATVAEAQFAPPRTCTTRCFGNTCTTTCY
jgi:hypothetical protein